MGNKEDFKKEVRCYNSPVTRAKDSRKVEGYALLFNVQSDGLDFKEVISKNALTMDTVNKSNVFCLLNHDQRRGVLARSKYGTGSLKLEIDEKGLKYTFEAPNTDLGNELLEMLSRGDIDSSSFCMGQVESDWHDTEDGEYVRTITKIGYLYDVSPVYDAAYSQTTVDRRGLDQLKESKDAAKAEKRLADYYKNLNKEFSYLN